MRRSTRTSLPAPATCDIFETNMDSLFKKIGLRVEMVRAGQITIPKTWTDFYTIEKRGAYIKFGQAIGELAAGHFKTNTHQPYHIQLGWKPIDGTSPHSMALVIFMNGRIEFFDANGKMEPNSFISDKVMQSILESIKNTIPNGHIILVNNKNINKGGHCVQWSIFYHYFRHLILTRGILNNNLIHI